MKIAVVLFDGVEEMDFTGPYEVLANVAEVFTVAPKREVKGRHGLKVTADYTFGNEPEADVLVIPGGPVTRENPAVLEDVAEYVRKLSPSCRYTLSVSTGAFIAARAGLLDDRLCTTHTRRRHQLGAQYPSAKVRFDRVVVDGRLVSTAGVSAGIDGALYIVSRLADRERAAFIASQIEYPWHSSRVLHASGPAAESAHA